VLFADWFDPSGVYADVVATALEGRNGKIEIDMYLAQKATFVVISPH
jgi:hypothetical protein